MPVNGKKFARYRIDPYGYNIYIILGEEELKEFVSWATFSEETNERLLSPSAGFSYACCDDTGTPNQCVFYLAEVQEDEDKVELLKTIAHEAVHTIDFMIKHYMKTPEQIDMEVRAYHVDSLFGRVLNEVLKRYGDITLQMQKRSLKLLSH